MAYKHIDIWQPSKKGTEILNRAMEHIQSVTYKVSLRWVFYRLLQEGYYNKTDYQKFVGLASRARHAYFGKWRPDTVSDETRSPIGDARQSVGKKSVKDCIEDLRANIYLNPMYGQDNYVEVWFEAKAMSGQFKKYVPNVILRPMGGQPSIPYKWQAAKELEGAYSKYGQCIDCAVLW